MTNDFIDYKGRRKKRYSQKAKLKRKENINNNDFI